MKSMIKIMVLLVAIVSAATAKDVSSWAAVEQLSPGTRVKITTVHREKISGTVISVGAAEIAIENSQAGLPARTIAKSEVKEICKFRSSSRPKISRKQVLLASAIGIGVGIGIGAAVDSAHPSIEDPEQGKLIGGVLGATMGPAALCLGSLISSAANRKELVYRIP
jgi:hypothetical protein